MTAMPAFSPSVFVSHSSQDKPFVDRLVRDLRSRLGNPGLVWYDQTERDTDHGRDLEPGDDWQDTIWREIDSRNVFVVVISQSAIASPWVRDEVSKAWRAKNDRGMVIIPVMYLPCKADELYGALGNLQIVSFEPPDGALPTGAIATEPQPSEAALHDAIGAVDYYEKRFEDLLYAVTLGMTREVTQYGQPPRDHLVWLPLPRHFIGREDELATLCDLLRKRESAEILAVNGLGGIGKTTLAAKAVHVLDSEGQFPDGIAVVDCKSKGNRADAITILRTVLSRFTPDRQPPSDNDIGLLTRYAREHLTGRRALVVLDNVEHRLPIAVVTAPLQSTQIPILITARAPLVLSIVPRDDRVVLGVLSDDEALELFISIFGRKAWEQLDADQRAAGKAIVARLGMHTKAIEILGGYASETGRDLRILQRELADPKLLLDIALPQHVPEPVKAIFVPSYRSLPADAKRLFAGLATFPTLEFGRRATIALAQSLEIENPDTAISLLVNRQFLSAASNDDIPIIGDGERLRMHSLVRDFAITQRAERGQKWSRKTREAADMTLARFYARYVNQVPDVALETDEKNIYGLLVRAYKQKQDEIVLQMCMGLRRYWRIRDQRKAARLFLKLGIKAAERLQQESEEPHVVLQMSDLQVALADLLRRQGDFEDAEQILHLNLALRRSLRDLRGEQMVLIQLGLLAESQDQWDSADTCFRQAWELAQRRRDQGAIATCLRHRGRAALERQQWEAAERYLRTALVNDQRLGNRLGESSCLWSLGRLAFGGQRLDDAETMFGQALNIARELNNRENQGATLSQLGRIAVKRGHLDDAENTFRQALDIAIELNNPDGQGADLLQLGQIAIKREKWGDAHELIKQALQIGRARGKRQMVTACLDDLIRIAQARRNKADENTYIEQRAQESSNFAWHRKSAIKAAQFGHMALALGQYADAERAFTRALEVAQRFHNLGDQVAHLTELGTVALAQQDWKKAERYLDDARSVKRRLGDSSIGNTDDYALITALGRLAFDRQDWERASEFYQQALTRARSRSNAYETTNALCRLGRIERGRKHWKPAVDYLREALDLSRSESHLQIQYSCLLNLGQIDLERKHWDDAEQWFQATREVAVQLNDEHGIAITHAMLGRLAINRASTEPRLWINARQHYERALEIAQRLFDWRGAVKNLSQLAFIARSSPNRDYSTALRYAQAAYDIAQEHNDIGLLSQALNQLGPAQRALGQHEEAQTTFLKLLELNRKSGSPRDVMHSLAALGRDAIETGHLDEAKEWLEEALTLSMPPYGTLQSDELEARHNLGHLAMLRWQWRQAWDYTDQARELARQLKQPHTEVRELMQWSQIAMAIWRWADAESFLQEAQSILEDSGLDTRKVAIQALSGRVAVGQKNWEKARLIYDQARALNERNGQERFVGANLSQLGKIALETHQWAEAKLKYTAARKIAAKLQDGYEEGMDMAQLGVIESVIGSREKAIALMRDGLDKVVSSRTLAASAQVRAAILTNLGKVLLQGPDTWQEGRVKLYEALKIYREMDLPEAEALLLEMRSLGYNGE